MRQNDSHFDPRDGPGQLHEHKAAVAEYVRLALMAAVIVASLTGWWKPPYEPLAPGGSARDQQPLLSRNYVNFWGTIGVDTAGIVLAFRNARPDHRRAHPCWLGIGVHPQFRPAIPPTTTRTFLTAELRSTARSKL